MVKVVGIIVYQGLRCFRVEQIAVTLRNKNQVCTVTWFFRCYDCYSMAKSFGEKKGIMLSQWWIGRKEKWKSQGNWRTGSFYVCGW